MSPRRPDHLKTFDYLGLHRYSLTFCTRHRRRLFIEDSVVTLVLSQIVRAATEEEIAIVAYCFMPDHLHLLIAGQSTAADCRRFVARSKQFSGYAHARRFGAPLWQRYNFEHVLRGEEATVVVARYILENPIRAGLVRDVLRYPYVGSLVYELKDLLESIH